MNLTEEAESLLLHQFSRSPKLKGLIRALAEPFDASLTEIEKLHHGRYIEEAKGERLDILGDIVGQSRQGMDDVDYRAWIQVAIRINICSGTPEDILAILRIIYGKKPDVIMEERPPNDVIFTFLSLPKAPLKTVFNIIRKACPVNTKCHFVRAYQESIV